MKNKYLIIFLSIFLGIFFIVSGIGKIVNVTGFQHILESYGLGYFSYLAPVICVAEITLGLLMIFLVDTKKYSLICFFALLIFTISFAYGYFFKNVKDCGCFGEIDILKSSPTLSFVRNIILMILCIVLNKISLGTERKTVRWKRNIILSLTCLFFVLSGFTMSEPIISNIPFKDQKVENTPLINYLKPNADSTYLIFVFSYQCSHCWDATENIKSYTKQKIVDRIVGIGMGDSLAEFNYRKAFNIDFQTINVNADSKKIADVFPTAFIIKNNKVEYVMQRTIYNAFTFSFFNPLFNSK